jgi:hypothetical protein
MTDMIKLANGTEVPADVFYTWSAKKQYYNLVPISDERRQQISKSRKGVAKSAEHRAKLSASKTGYKLSEETKLKMAQARLGRKFNKPVMTPNGIFESRTAVALAAGVDPTTVGNWMKKWPEHYYYIKKESA